MAGCSSCSGCSADNVTKPYKQAEKLEPTEVSGNTRYPHVIVGRQAIYADDSAQMIVEVVEDNCSSEDDKFVLKAQRILKDKLNRYSEEEQFSISKPARGKNWKLHALI